MVGQVKVIKEGGYGFIISDTGEEYFFHHSVFQGNWEALKRICPPLSSQGPQVVFKEQWHKKGPRAYIVELV
jgi:cold shock CspA family protein